MSNEQNINGKLMVIVGLLDQLWEQPESASVEFKAPFVFGKDKKSTFGLVKDIIALANTDGGGYIIIGKQDKGGALSCSDEVLDSFDVSKVHDIVDQYAVPKPEFLIHRSISPDQTNAILIIVVEFVEVPLICAKDANDEKNCSIMCCGALYIRSNSNDAKSTAIKNEQDMRHLINRAMLKNRDILIEKFSVLINSYLGGQTQKSKIDYSQEWLTDQTKLSTKVDKKLARSIHHMRICLHPSVYEVHRFNNQDLQRIFSESLKRLKCLFLDSKVDYENSLILASNDNRFSFLNEIEFLRSVLSVDAAGFIVFDQQLPEIKKCTPKPLYMPWVQTSVFLLLVFAKRFYFNLPLNETLCFEISVWDVHDRKPAADLVSPLESMKAYGSSDAITSDFITFLVDIVQEDLSNGVVEPYVKLMRCLLDKMEIKNVSDQDLRDEVMKFIELLK